MGAMNGVHLVLGEPALPLPPPASRAETASPAPRLLSPLRNERREGWAVEAFEIEAFEIEASEIEAVAGDASEVNAWEIEASEVDASEVVGATDWLRSLLEPLM